MASYHLNNDRHTSSTSSICSPSLVPKFDTSRIVTFKHSDTYPVLIVDRIKQSPIFDRIFIYQLKDVKGNVYKDGAWVPEPKLVPADIQASPKVHHKLEAPYVQETAPQNSPLGELVVKHAPRPFPCLLRPLCSLNFGSKNEWKRHTSIQHLCLGYFRCKIAPCDSSETPPPANKDQRARYNDFNRKDLFTQHIRRKHMPKKFRKSSGALTDAGQKEWETRMLPDIHREMWVEVRQPPTNMRCGCGRVFKGYEAWQERMECLGHHLKNIVNNKYDPAIDAPTNAWLTGKAMDPEMVRWMESEGLLIRCAEGEMDSFNGYRFPKDSETFKFNNGDVSMTG